MLIHAFFRYLLQFVNVYQRFLFVLHINCQVTCPTKWRADKEENLIDVEDVWYWLCKLSVKILSGIAPDCQTVWI